MIDSCGSVYGREQKTVTGSQYTQSQIDYNFPYRWFGHGGPEVADGAQGPVCTARPGPAHLLAAGDTCTHCHTDQETHHWLL